MTNALRRSALHLTSGSWWRRIAREVGLFGLVGALAYVIDVGVFNLLRTATFGAMEHAVLEQAPITAKCISTLVATLFSYVGNRYLTYRDRLDNPGAPSRGPQLFWFLVTNALGLAFTAGCLWVSHHLMGLTSPLADNVSGNVIGVGLSTIGRWFAYRTFIFPQQKVEREAADSPESRSGNPLPR